MEVSASSRDRSLTLQLRGELDHHGARGLIRRAEREIETTLPNRLTLDFGGVSFMDSSGIAVVMRCRQRMRELGGTVTLRRVAPQPRRVFDASGVTKLIAIE
ncbi:MAG: STAS domain-containing protein [Oscillospiraceae bacterium]|jgi:stage II sporulation protein AA (anti-sigma F factor antagonist)|nr:STAS domain-containing protein [Oscillospiraceae bacterium]